MNTSKEEKNAINTIKNLIRTPYGWRILAAAAIQGGDSRRDEYIRLLGIIGKNEVRDISTLEGDVERDVNVSIRLGIELYRYIVELTDKSEGSK